MNVKASASGTPSVRSRTASSNDASSRSRICARRPLQLAGESRKMRDTVPFQHEMAGPDPGTSGVAVCAGRGTGLWIPGVQPATGGSPAMATTSSFDVSTGADLQEVDNAINQARKEIQQRYDFKGTNCTIEFDRGKSLLTLEADDEYKLKAVYDV